MATKKDLVEAYAFSRRRLVTAFVSGAPGGREVEPARPGRTIVAGIALAVLLLAGAAIAGVFKDIAPGGWDQQPGLVIDKDSGALYVVLADDQIPGSDPTLRSVVNVTSAQLILGADVQAQSVPGDEIADTPKGPPIGLIGAPATVPDPDQLIDDGWTACTADGQGVRAVVTGSEEATPDPDVGVIISHDDDLYLVAEAPAAADEDRPANAHVYPLPRRADKVTTALGLRLPDEAIDVPDKWFDLFQPGGSLDEQGFDLPGAGRRVTGDAAPYVEPGTRVGDYFTDGDRHWVVLQNGAAELSPFEFQLLSHLRFGGHKPNEVKVPDGIQYGEKPWDDASQFPQGPLHPPATDQVCAVLDTDPDLPPAVRLAVDPSDDASASGLRMKEVHVTVMSGHGAVVDRGGSSGEAGLPYLVDDRGMSYQIDGDDAIENLGYDGVPEVVVPDDWMELFTPGAVLSVQGALCEPSTHPEGRCR